MSSAGLHNWAFTLTVFASMYAKKFGVEVDKMMEKLWGYNFFDSQDEEVDQEAHRRRRLASAPSSSSSDEFTAAADDAAKNEAKEKLWPMLEKLGVKAKLKPADFDHGQAPS